MLRKLLVTLVLALALAFDARSQPQMRAQLVSSTFDRPSQAIAPAGDVARLFVLEQWTGLVRTIKLPSLQIEPEPFVHVTDVLNATGSDGLLAMAFHPDWPTVGHIYVFYTRAPSPGTTVVRRYTTDASNPGKIDPASALDLLVLPLTTGIHKGGWLGFGGDGLLYICTGDGGPQGDPNNHAQRLDVLMGKILRVDPSFDQFPSDPTRNYAIPPSNPFIAVPDALPEIWATGLRNPWRADFDPATGELWVADPGWNSREEVTLLDPLQASGANLGWRCMEGTLCHAFAGCECPHPGATPPIFEYDAAFGPGGSCAIVGGDVYRGCAFPHAQGQFFFADYCSGVVASLERVGSGVVVHDWTAQLNAQLPFPIQFVSSVNADARGELWITCSWGGVYRVLPDTGPAACTCHADCDSSGSLNVFDFICFGNAYNAQQLYADCDANTQFNIFDFVCFGNAYAAGCP